jgi:hypothetical protein
MWAAWTVELSVSNLVGPWVGGKVVLWGGILAAALAVLMADEWVDRTAVMKVVCWVDHWAG